MPQYWSQKMLQNLETTGNTWSASELRKLSANERDAILTAAAALAENEYRTNKSLTDFEAFGEDDLHGESTAAPTG
jgi:hypothetical protein